MSAFAALFLRATRPVLVALAATGLFVLAQPATQAGAATTKIAFVNFQPAWSTTPTGYVADIGAPYLSSRGYGWIAATSSTPQDMDAYTRDRASEPDNRLDTLIHMQPNAGKTGRWELAVPKGVYEVSVGVGDPEYFDSVHTVRAENMTLVSRFVPSPSRPYRSGSARLWVTDGKLTLDANGGTNTKLQYVTVSVVNGTTSTTKATTTTTTRPATTTTIAPTTVVTPTSTTLPPTTVIDPPATTTTSTTTAPSTTVAPSTVPTPTTTSTTVAPTTSTTSSTLPPTTASTTTTAPPTTLATTTVPVTSTPSTTVPSTNQFRAVLNPASGTTGWTIETSGSQEQVVVGNDSISCRVGGYSASTHYARIKRKLPEVDDFAAKKAFSLTSTFELPSDFYSNQQSYMRFMNTDNYTGQYKTSRTSVGAKTQDEWRVGFLVYGGDRLPRLISAHENHQEMELWRGTSPLPVGKHTVEIRMNPSKTTTGSWDLFIDGVRVGGKSNVQTVPASLADSEVAVTRIVGGIDGAADQDTKSVAVKLYSLDFRAEK